jgi:cytochrome c-type biogenesis protein
MFAQETPGFLTALGAGFLSFITPCVLPTIPAYISYISGLSINELKDQKDKGISWGILIKTAFFVLGFTTLYIILGVFASTFGSFIRTTSWLPIASGVIIMVFGLHISGFIPIKFLYADRRVRLGSNKLSGVWGPYLLGFTFSLGWSACTGPILGPILLIAANKGTVGKGVVLLFLYSLGLGIPFLLSSVFINAFLGFIAKIKKYFRIIEIVAGIFLMLMGLYLIIFRHF